MSYYVVFHPTADKEYSEAYQWYEERLEGLGDSFAEAVQDQLNRIISKPLLYPKKRASFHEAKTDSFPYLIVYKIYDKKKIILISSIYHTSRNPKKKYRK